MRQVVLYLLLWFLTATAFVAWDSLDQPLNQKTKIWIKPGWSGKRVVWELSQRNLLKCPTIFYLCLKLTHCRVKAGEYQITPSLTQWKLLNNLCQGKGQVRYKVTIPEGSTLRHIAHILKRKGLINQAIFLKLAHNKEFCHELGVRASSLEGFLFPTTYFFEKRPSEERYILRTMVKEFWQHDKKYIPLAAKKGLTFYQTLILASIIEKETSLLSEKPLIASVYLNRLRLKMPLQADPTILYILPAKKEITPSDLKIPSPYNTYLHLGLPPTPICNPSEESIKAVVEAPQTPYLYFVSMGNGHHYFSRNFKEHKKAIQRFLTKKKIPNRRN